MDEDVDGTRSHFRRFEAGKCHVEADEASEDEDGEHVEAEVGHPPLVGAENVSTVVGPLEKFDPYVQDEVDGEAEDFNVDH